LLRRSRDQARRRERSRDDADADPHTFVRKRFVRLANLSAGERVRVGAIDGAASMDATHTDAAVLTGCQGTIKDASCDVAISESRRAKGQNSRHNNVVSSA